MMLLQEIRAKQALEEINRVDKIIINHPTPWTMIGDKKYTLVFPKYMFDYESEKTIDILFIGKITPKRHKFLELFPNATIIHSERGRDIKTKVKDVEYFNEMSKSKFTLCPNGDFVWTYRFFESIIFKSIPIIEEFCDIYDGYNYYTHNDEFIYRTDWVEDNLNKLKREMTL